jgi:hypothetical protein
MWGHYADRHRGVCLEFDSSIEPFRQAAAVHYSTKYPSLDASQDFFEILRERVFLTKAAPWSYEEEFRMLGLEGGLKLPAERLQHLSNTTFLPALQDGLLQFSQGALKSVVAGCRMAQSDRDTLLSMKAQTTEDVEFKQAIISDDSYELRIAPL